MNPWFTTEKIDETTWAFGEDRHWEETRCYLLEGRERRLLIDTGLGVCSLGAAVRALTDQPVVAALTHAHWDHIGSLSDFPDFCAHAAELDWLQGAFPLPIAAVRRMVAERCALPAGFDLDGYRLFQGTPTRLLCDGDTVDLGGRIVQALHTPGHSPGHLCFWEAARGYLFTGDLVYSGALYADYPSTDPAAYLRSLEKVAALPARRILPGYHSLDVAPALVSQMRDALQGLRQRGLLRHGSGTFNYGNWAIRL